MHDVGIGVTELQKQKRWFRLFSVGGGSVFMSMSYSINTYWSSVSEEPDHGIQPLSELNFHLNFPTEHPSRLELLITAAQNGGFLIKTRLLKSYQHLQHELKGIKARWGIRATRCSGGGHSTFNPTTTEFPIFSFPTSLRGVWNPILRIVSDTKLSPGGFFSCSENQELTKGFF